MAQAQLIGCSSEALENLDPTYLFCPASLFVFIWLYWVLVVASRIFSCEIRDLVPLCSGAEPRPLALKAWVHNYWSTKESPSLSGGLVYCQSAHAELA